MQMAIDRWLLQQHIAGKIPPTLRFYTWSPIAISLGYHQRNYPPHWDNLIWQGISVELVKRPTGGRGVLHQGDLTYAIICSGMSGKRSEIYSQICQFLIAGWQQLGIELNYGSVGRGYIHNPNCFGTATAADLICENGYKLIGSAQLIQEGAILQHGSMQLKPDRALFTQVFGTEISSPPTTIADISISTIIDALVKAAQDCFKINVRVQPLTTNEWKEIQQFSQ
jgi:lipoate-protein ligase A